MTKAMCELFINDHSRKGHFDGRSARLPTVIIRPGKPNAAASSWASGMFREPLNREFCELPIRRGQCHPMTGYRTVIDSLIALHEVAGSALRDDYPGSADIPVGCILCAAQRRCFLMAGRDTGAPRDVLMAGKDTGAPRGCFNGR